MTPAEAFRPFANSVIGLPISHVWRGYGSALVIELGNLMPVAKHDGSPGNPEGEVSLVVEWSWRIEDRMAIRCGSWGEEDRWEPAFDTLRGGRVAQCELFGALPEVMLTTDAGVRFLSFSTTDGQPQWHLVDRRDGPPRWFERADFTSETERSLGTDGNFPPVLLRFSGSTRIGSPESYPTGLGRKTCPSCCAPLWSGGAHRHYPDCRHRYIVDKAGE